jgi:hypothetical protein
LREALLATIAMTYSYIQYDEAIGSPISNDVANRLQRILKDEEHPFVRDAGVAAICQQAQNNFKKNIIRYIWTILFYD